MIAKLSKFFTVGLATALLYTAALVVAVEYLGVSPVIASVVCYGLAIAFNYFSHYRWTYNLQGNDLATALRYMSILALGFGVNAAIMYTGVNILGHQYILVQAVAFCGVVVLNFIAYSLWVFRAD